jgi:catechol 2,3-dioxygenase-like lactoylglutathione lyase family enzyme
MTTPPKVRRLARFSLTTADVDRLAAFYKQAFGCQQIADYRLKGDAFRELMGVESDARCVKLGLGQEVIDLVEFDTRGQPYPVGALPSALVFQHFAIVTADMTKAWFQLSRTEGWSAITTAGPQRLPESSGGVTAFKFRDPEGHPLELLSFRRNHTPRRWRVAQGGAMCLGIDHSAISVSDTAASVGFYTTLGLSVSTNSRNAGPEQDTLDGLAHVMVDVTGLAPASPAPHVELLCYHGAVAAHPTALCANDIAATRLVFENADTSAPLSLTDPDGHHLMIFPNSNPPRAA